jgi:hypothetical protein
MTETSATSATSKRNPREPYCSNCGYTLTGLTDSSKCPECGRPLVEVLTRAPRFYESGKRYRSRATLWGLPVIDIALGPKNGELRGRAKGIIAIGDIATGGIAIGGVARGIVAIGGVALGGFCFGGCSIGLFAALGGAAIGGLATGGAAIGALAAGGGAIGIVAQGGGAVGYIARGGSAVGVHTISMFRASPVAQSVFDSLRWFFGPWPPGPATQLQPLMTIGFATFVAALVIGAIAMWKLRSE